MKTVLLVGGGSGGHVAPLVTIARELLRRQPDLTILAVCEKHSAFARLLEEEPAIQAVYQVRAGKFRRYGGQSWLQTLTDYKTIFWNARDVVYAAIGIWQAWRLLRRLRPDSIFIKGGFVGVPVGTAAGRLGIRYITHDSDTTPGLANRLIAARAWRHATALPTDFYPYPARKSVFVGIPIAPEFTAVTAKQRSQYRAELGLGACRQVVAVIGGSQGALSLNRSFTAIAPRLMQQDRRLGIIHISGQAHQQQTEAAYSGSLLADECRRVVVKGFVNDMYRYTGAATLVVTRAGANTIAELAAQLLPAVLVPGKLAGNHQVKNARFLAEAGAVDVVDDNDPDALFVHVQELLRDGRRRRDLAAALGKMSQPDAAAAIAGLIISAAAKE